MECPCEGVCHGVGAELKPGSVTKWRVLFQITNLITGEQCQECWQVHNRDNEDFFENLETLREFTPTGCATEHISVRVLAFVPLEIYRFPAGTVGETYH